MFEHPPVASKEVCKVTGKDVYELGDISKFLDGQAKSEAELADGTSGKFPAGPLVFLCALLLFEVV